MEAPGFHRQSVWMANRPQLDLIVDVEQLEELAALARERRTFIIASADLAHVGPQFGDPDPY